MEWLDKEFPNGYLILYTCKDGQLRFAKYNPRRLEVLEDWHSIIVQMGKDKEQCNWMDEERREDWRG